MRSTKQKGDFKLDATNKKYSTLLQEKNQSVGLSPGYKLADSPAISTRETLVYSTAIAPKSFLKDLPITSYNSLNEPALITLAKKATLVRKKMFAGIGSSIERKTHLKKYRPSKDSELGAKGTDLFISIAHPNGSNDTITLSFAEAQLLQGILSAEKGNYAKVVFEDLVSDETLNSLQEVWRRPCVLSPSYSYEEYISKSAVLARVPVVVQANLPTLTPDGKLSHNRLAPAGHGFFGFETLYRILHSSNEEKKLTFSFISNGEDLAASPDPSIIGWMINSAVPLCMVVTEKTEQDRKGGQLAIVAEQGVPQYVTLVETAQARASHQLKLFEDLGLSIKADNQSAYFNTNLAVFNESLLRTRLLELTNKVGEEALYKALTPDVIHNWKDQTDKDGVKRQYLQLEGAMGSVYLNLDRLSRSELGKPLVHFVLVSKEDRSKFFAPVKTAFDLFLQYYSNLYVWDPVRFRPLNKYPGKYPTVKVDSDDVETVLEQFKGKDLSSYFL